MRMILALVVLSSMMVSCATLRSMPEFSDSTQAADAPPVVLPDPALNVPSEELAMASPAVGSSETSNSSEWAHQETEPIHLNQEATGDWQKPEQIRTAERKSVKKTAIAKKSKTPAKKSAIVVKKAKPSKAVAKKSKVDCKKIAKQVKKAKKTDVAFCKAEKKKLAGKKGRSVASKF